MEISLLNGQPTTLSLNHRGLAFGDGLFETCLVSEGKIHCLSAHMDRLRKGCEVLHLSIDEAFISSLLSLLRKLTQSISKPHVLKIMLLRRYDGRGYDFDPDKQQTDTIVAIRPYQKPGWCQGARVITAKTPVTENTVLAGLKHLNRLDSVLARQEARRAQVDEAILSTSCGQMIESSMGNLFVKIKGSWLTPSIDRAGVRGIVRQQLLTEFPDQISIQSVDLADLSQVESAFLTNSLIGLVPIISLNHRDLKGCQTVDMFQLFVRQKCV
jgi:4-amino-4-deoxychorismate lyase